MGRDRRAARETQGALLLPGSLEAALHSGHPWIYRDHVPRDVALETGAWVRVRAGRAEAFALWDGESPIALRVFSRQAQPDAAWFDARVRDALSLRRQLIGSNTDAFRVLYGEGDGVPGIVVDWYAGYAVIVTYSAALDPIISWICDALQRQLSPKGILWRRSSRQAGASLELIAGHRPPEDHTVTEEGLRYYADLETGQKTGLFLDQRDNRQTLARFVKTGTLLNLFAYTGGFSVVAASRGARHVTTVDLAEPAIVRAKDNFELNSIPSVAHEFVVRDCYDYLSDAMAQQSAFDVVVCDPPSLARSRAQLEGAIKAYTLLNARGIRCTKVGGYYAAASCTSQISPDAFRHMLGEASRRAERRLQIVHEMGHAIDHPHFAAHPEGRYLKFIVGRVLELS